MDEIHILTGSTTNGPIKRAIAYKTELLDDLVYKEMKEECAYQCKKSIEELKENEFVFLIMKKEHVTFQRNSGAIKK